MASENENTIPLTDYNMSASETTEIPSIPPEIAEKFKMEQAQREELAKKMKSMLEKVRKNSEGFNKEISSKFKKELKGIVLLPPRPHTMCAKCESKNIETKETRATCKSCGASWKTLDVLVMLQVEGKDFNDKIRKRDEYDRKIKTIADKKLKDANASAFIVDELWDMCLKGKYEIINLISMGMPLYDSGLVGAIRLVEIHKQMVMKKFEKYVVTYGMAGSLIRGEAHKDSDVDTFVVIDDTDVTRMTARELVSKLRALIWNMGARAGEMSGVKNKLNVQIWLLTDMWDSLRTANPIIFTTIRDAVPLYDRGMFAPWKLLLKQGKIVPTPESTEMFIKTGRQVIDRIKLKLREIAVEDFFWGTITPSQGALMSMGVPPPHPNATPSEVRTHFVKAGLLEESWAKFLDEVMELRKDIEHGKIKDVDPKIIEKMMGQMNKYINRLDKLVVQVDNKASKTEISNLYEKTVEDVSAALKMVGIQTTSDKALGQAKKLVEKKLSLSRYLTIIKRIEDLKVKTSPNRREVAALAFEQDKLAKDTFELIRAEKGKNVEKYKISATYKKDKRADIWLFTDEAFLVLDVTQPKTDIKKYKIDKKGAFGKSSKATLEELNRTLETFAGTATTLTAETIDSLKKVLADDLKIVVGA